MKTLSLIALAILTLNTSAFARDKHMGIALDSLDRVEAPVPDVRHLTVGLRRAVLWAWFLTRHPSPTALDLAAGVQLVESLMILRGEGATRSR